LTEKHLKVLAWLVEESNKKKINLVKNTVSRGPLDRRGGRQKTPKNVQERVSYEKEVTPKP